MRTSEFLAASMLVAVFLVGCTNTEEPVTANSEEAIRITAGIGEPTRAVIDAGYGADLNVSFARIDNQPAGMNWNTPSIDAIRTGGAGNTAITFEQEQNYLAANGVSALIGYYPRKTPEAGMANPLRVVYTITGDEDIMARRYRRDGWRPRSKYSPLTTCLPNCNLFVWGLLKPLPNGRLPVLPIRVCR